MPNYNQGFQGAAGGAMTGATLGTMLPIPGVGTGIGALAGGALGGLGGLFGGGPDSSQYNLPGFDERNKMLNQQIGNYQGPQIGQFQNASMGGDFRSGQLQLMGQLQEQAAGRGPSLAQAQFDQNLSQGVNAQQAQAQTGMGNSALAAESAASNIGLMTQNLAGQAGQARMQEQLTAQQQLGALTGQGRAQELQGSQYNTGMQNDRLASQAQMEMQYNMRLRDLELQNAQLQQAGQMGAQQQNTGPGIGSQILAGGGALGANYFANQMGGAQDPPPTPQAGMAAFGNQIFNPPPMPGGFA